MLVRFIQGIILVISLAGCSGENGKNDKYIEWENDPNGCKGMRASMLPKIDSLRSSFIGKTQDEMLYLLGKPDINDLQDRSKSRFAYYIEGAEGCKETTNQSTILVLNFNSLNQVRFATIQHW